jgi:hypothetical protein
MTETTAGPLRSRVRMRRRGVFALLLLCALGAHYHFFYLQPASRLSEQDKDFLRYALSVCVDAPLLAPIPKRFTVHRNSSGRVLAIDAAVFYGVVLYRVRLVMQGGDLESCSVDYFPGPYRPRERHPADPNYR